MIFEGPAVDLARATYYHNILLLVLNMNAARFGFRTTKSVLRIRKRRPGRVQIASSTTTATSSSAENGKKYRQQQHLKQQKKAKYLLPKRIILLRHGESLGNIDDTAYANIPDWKIPLTRRCVVINSFVCSL